MLASLHKFSDRHIDIGGTLGKHKDRDICNGLIFLLSFTKIVQLVSTASMKSTLVWDVMPCSPVKSTALSKECTASIFRV
jgi:hypothetical protein